MHAIKVNVYNQEAKTKLVINGIVDDVLLNCIDSDYVNESIQKHNFENILEKISLKDLLVFNDTNNIANLLTSIQNEPTMNELSKYENTIGELIKLPTKMWIYLCVGLSLSISFTVCVCVSVCVYISRSSCR